MRMFTEDMKRDPTNVELFDIAQSNSEHRHVPTGTGCVRFNTPTDSEGVSSLLLETVLLDVTMPWFSWRRQLAVFRTAHGPQSNMSAGALGKVRWVCSNASCARACTSRHWFFGAKLVLDGVEAPETLMQMVKATLRANPNNSVIGFKDNSSAIRRVACACCLGLKEDGHDPDVWC